MKRNTLLFLLVFALLLSGCSGGENPWQVDTVVRIPVDPTESAIAVPTEAEENAVPTGMEAPTEATEPTETTEATEGKSGSNGKNPTSDKKTESTQRPKATEPASTEPPATEAPATEPETQPPTEVVTEVSTEPPYDPSEYSVGSLEKAILKEMNTYRAEAGLNELSISRKLSGIAALRGSEALAIWSHTRPDGRSYTTAMSDYGYGFGASAENLAHANGTGDAEAIVAKWMDTDSKDNILNENFATAGIGVYRSGGVTLVAVLLVG